MKSLLIWGAGDQGTVALECALAMNVYESIDFLGLKEKERRDIPGYVIYSERETVVDELLKAYDEVIVATGDNNLREQKTALLTSRGIVMPNLIHPTAVVSPSARIAAGCTVLANAVIHTNASVGMGCIVNTASIVEHDCVIGDFVNLSPKTAMAGHTKIGNKSFLGIGCTIIDAITVGKEAVIGAGAVVIRDVPEHAVVSGVPAKGIRSSKNETE